MDAPAAPAPANAPPDADAAAPADFLARLAESRRAYALPPRLRAHTERAVRELLALLFPQLAGDDLPCGVRAAKNY